jgi:hypothetical protein
MFYEGDEVVMLRYHDGEVVFAKSRQRVVPILSDELLEYSMPEAEFEAAT